MLHALDDSPEDDSPEDGHLMRDLHSKYENHIQLAIYVEQNRM
jgi:hypothetical protein